VRIDNHRLHIALTKLAILLFSHIFYIPLHANVITTSTLFNQVQGVCMTGVLASVNSRTQLVGQNRLELLLFRFNNQQLYGINVFKVREVIRCPKLSSIPKSNSNICGVANIRGVCIPILDLAMATGLPGVEDQESAL
jgi:hypothetical protein